MAAAIDTRVGEESEAAVPDLLQGPEPGAG